MLALVIAPGVAAVARALYVALTTYISSDVFELAFAISLFLMLFIERSQHDVRSQACEGRLVVDTQRVRQYGERATDRAPEPDSARSVRLGKDHAGAEAADEDSLRSPQCGIIT